MIPAGADFEGVGQVLGDLSRAYRGQDLDQRQDKRLGLALAEGRASSQLPASHVPGQLGTQVREEALATVMSECTLNKSSSALSMFLYSWQRHEQSRMLHTCYSIHSKAFWRGKANPVPPS